jgi:hypothetical protein
MVTGYPSYPAYPARGPLQLAEPAPVQVAIAETAPQRRVTVAFRLILIIPQLFLLLFLAIAAFVIAFLGWWGALFTGRLPEFAVNYLSGFMRWNLRVRAYLYLLTDAYPPFTLDDAADYPVRLAVPERERLNRAAVFFRVILAIPAAIVSGVAVQGASSILLFIAWLITLVTGKLPHSLHQALTAVLRYDTRFYCYYYMLTPTYPWGLFGDAGGVQPATAAPAYPAPDAWYGTQAGYAPSGYDAPGYGPAGYGPPGTPPTPGYGTPGSVYGAPGGYGVPGGYGPGHTVFQPASWQLILTSGARRLVVLVLVLGVLTYVVDGVRFGTSTERAIQRAQNISTTNNAINELNSSYDTLTGKMNQWQAAVTACDQNLTCVTKADGNAAGYFTAFGSSVRATPVLSGATAAASQVYSDANQVAREYTELSQATSVAEYQATFNHIGLQQTLNRFDTDFNALGTALNNS